MIKMYGYLPAWGCSDMSPYVSYTDAYLRLAGLPFTVEMLHQGDLTKAPKGKLPFIVDDDGTLVSDSVLIELYLKKKYGDRLDARLSKEQKGVSALVNRMFGESWYWYVVQTRYRRDEDFQIYDPLWVKFLSWLPEEQRREPVRIFRERLLTQFWHHGAGRNSEAEVEQLAFGAIDAVSDVIGDKQYFHDDQPSSIDAAVYSNLVHLMFTPFPGPIVDYANSKANLRAYTDRIFNQHYPHLAQDRKEAADMRIAAVKARKPPNADNDHSLEELFKGRPRKTAVSAG
jgi:glutathione S-transferase